MDYGTRALRDFEQRLIKAIDRAEAAERQRDELLVALQMAIMAIGSSDAEFCAKALKKGRGALENIIYPEVK